MTAPIKTPPPAPLASTRDAKRWFAWVCLALMVVSEIILFHALREKDAALTELSTTRAEMRQLQSALDEMKDSAAGAQFSEVARLRKQNEIYTNRLAKAQALIDQLEAESAKTAEKLATARSALQLQQQHLQQLQTENRMVTDASLAIICRNACLNNLRELDAAKQQWALERNKSSAAVPRPEDLLPYLKDGFFPSCPDGGSYLLNAVEATPACTAPGHVLPQ